MEKEKGIKERVVRKMCTFSGVANPWGWQPSVGEVQSRTDWDPVWTGPNPAVPVQVPDVPKDTGPLGLWSGHSHIAQDRLRPGLDRDCISYNANILFLIH